MIRNLLYVVHNRLDIAHPVGIVIRFLANPKETHMTGLECIFRYLKGIKGYGLCYKKEGEFDLRVYLDVDWDRNVMTKIVLVVDISF